VEYLGAFVLGMMVGWVFGILRPRRSTPPPRTTVIALRQAAPRTGDAYRDPAGDTVCTLEELRSDLATAGLPAVLDNGAIEIVRGKERIRIFPSDARRVTLASLDIAQTGCDAMYFELALALVPRFGPLRLAVNMFGVYSVDSTRDAAGLVDERSERIRAIAAAIANDMRDKQTAYGDLS